MHISEGVLPPAILGTGWLLTALGTGISLGKMSEKDIPRTGVMAAFFFVASLVHINTGATSAHLVMSGLAGVILGWNVFPAILSGLFLQALLFQYGGLTVLGVNTFNMAFPALVLGLIARKIISTSSSKILISSVSFVAGAGAILLSAFLVALSLFASGKGFAAPAALVFASHVVIFPVEGVVTMFIVGFLVKANFLGSAIGTRKNIGIAS